MSELLCFSTNVKSKIQFAHRVWDKYDEIIILYIFSRRSYPERFTIVNAYIFIIVHLGPPWVLKAPCSEPDGTFSAVKGSNTKVPQCIISLDF